MQKVRAWGPGLHGGIVGRSADFVVESIGSEVGTLGFAIEGPSQAKIEYDDQNDGSCDVKYWPKEPGEYAVHIMCDDEDIKDSPYMAFIHPATGDYNPDLVQAYGPGLEKSGCTINNPAEFIVDPKDAGSAPLKILAQVSIWAWGHLHLSGWRYNVEMLSASGPQPSPAHSDMRTS